MGNVAGMGIATPDLPAAADAIDLADRVVGVGEAWISRLDDDALRSLIELDARLPMEDS